MFKLYKNLTKKDWLFIVLIVCLTVLQVYFTMTIVDYVQGIIKSITYLNYHNNPQALGVEFETMVNTFGFANLSSAEFLASIGITGELASTIIAISTASTSQIWFNGLMMLLFAFLIMVVQTIISVLASSVAVSLSSTVRSKFYKKVDEFSINEINKFSTASLITRSTNDVQQVQMANLMMMRMVFAAPVTAIWALVKIRVSSAELTVATIIAIFALIVTIITLVVLLIPKFKVIQKLTDQLNLVTRENLTGIRVIRAFNAESYQENKFYETNNKFTKTQIFTGKVMAAMSPSMILIMNGISLAIYWLGAHLINNGSIDYATVTSFMMLSSQIIMAFIMLMMMFIFWPRACVSAGRINEVLETESSIKNPEIEISPTQKGKIEFKNVSFKYSDGDENILDNISFTANFGETVAIIGGTGSGKTTLVNLIPRFYDVQSGEILVDGVNVKDLNLDTLRGKLGYVPQKATMFKGTIKENILLGIKNLSQITEEELDKATKIACCDEFINSKPEKLDATISAGGKNLSGGQKQRLQIARSVILKPEIYIFDDSFSALDYKTDKQIRQNLSQMAEKSTKIIVAQRIGTIMDADKIIVLKSGKIEGIGTHAELLKSCEEYKSIATSQLSEEELSLETKK